MVAIVSTLIISGFVLVMVYAAIVTILQYGHLIGPAWRMEDAQPRGALVSMRGQRQPIVVRHNANRPAPVARASWHPSLRAAA